MTKRNMKLSRATRHKAASLVAVGLVAVGLALATASCGSSSTDTGTTANAPVTFKIGALPGTLNAKAVTWLGAHLASKYGVKVQLDGIADPVALSSDTANGQLAANWVATTWYTGLTNNSTHMNEDAVAPLLQLSFSLKSDKYKSISALPDNPTLLVPDDPVSMSVCLQFLSRLGLVTLKPGVKPYELAQTDIVKNPKNIQFKRVAYSQVTRSFSDVDFAFNVDEAWDLTPNGGGGYVLYSGYPSAPAAYVDTLDVLAKNLNQPGYNKLIQAFNSSAFLHEVSKLSKGSGRAPSATMVSGWKPTSGLQYTH